MKTRFISTLALLLSAAAAPSLTAQQLPVLTAQMIEVDAGGSVFGSGATVSPPGTNQLNGASMPYTDFVTMWALGSGTFPQSGYTYNFFVNGINIGTPPNVTPVTTPNGISWTPPQPGAYFFSCTVSDGSHTANSVAVEYFATGITIVSPEPNAIVPVGSSVVIQAAAATPFNLGAVSRVDFFDENGFLGSSRSFPYSIIYTPPGAAGTTHFIHATSFDASGNTFAVSTAQGIQVVAAVGPLPRCSISSPTGTPTAPSTIPIPDYVANPQATIPIIVNASSPTGNIQQVQLYINGVLFGTQSNYPYQFEWAPTVTATYNLTALAYDDKNNVVASTTSSSATETPSPTTVIVGSIPSVAITSPGNGGTINGGGTATITATATDNNTTSTGAAVQIVQVQFFQDGNFVGVATAPSGTNSYTVSFTPKQLISPSTGLPEPSILTAVASDSLGFTGTSPSISVTVTAGGSGGGVIVGTPPTVNLTAPSNQSSVVVNTPVTLSATAQATNNPGNVVQVEFLVDNVVLSTATQYPYSVIWMPPNLGSYSIVAQVTDNLGNKTNSSPITVNVVVEPPPTVSITAPTSGSIVTVNSSMTINASATSPNGTIAQVQFLQNGVPISKTSAQPYTASFTPTSTGVYTLSAVATDNSGETTTSSSTVVLVVPVTGGLGTTIYFGQALGIANSGRFALAVTDGTYATIIEHSSGGSAPSTTFASDMAVSGGGGFSAPSVSGTASATGVSGSFKASGAQFIGTVTQAGSVAVGSGLYEGNLVGQSSSAVTAIVGQDGEIMVYVNTGSSSDSGDATVDSSGAFTITTVNGNTITGVASPSTGFLTGTYSAGGTISAARVSGGTFSDGVLSNLSTRGQIGTGSNVMIAGFVVSGTASKNLLIRGVGPGLTKMGLPGAIASTQLTVYNSTGVVASNAGWTSTTNNQSAVTAADTASGAFPLTAGSADSALVYQFPPGSYTATLAGLSSATGIGLVEVYDLDALSPFTPNKLTNVSTRGMVGTGTSVMIGGINITGAAPKRLLIRGAGPALSTMGVTGSLSSSHLQLFNPAGGLIRENYSWQTGNDPGLLASAESSTGAFTFANGSADAAILIVLPPGSYTAELSGNGGATGVGLVEVYEVP